MKKFIVLMMTVFLLPLVAIGGETKCDQPIPTKRVFRPLNAIKSFFGILPVVPKTQAEIAAEKAELKRLQDLETQRTLELAKEHLARRQADLARLDAEKKRLEWELNSRQKQISELRSSTYVPPKKKVEEKKEPAPVKKKVEVAEKKKSLQPASVVKKKVVSEPAPIKEEEKKEKKVIVLTTTEEREKPKEPILKTVKEEIVDYEYVYKASDDVVLEEYIYSPPK